jgi:lipid-A-disaccharide synthase
LKRVAIVAGEASGDMLGAALIRALKLRMPDLEFEGIAGPKMIAEGARTLFPMEKLSVRGYVEAIRHVPEILGIRRKLGRHFLEQRPDLFIGIDAPDFNLGLETRLRAGGIRTVHYVSPSLWAWRPDRIDAVKRAVDHMLVVFPFEEEIYRKAQIPVTYVGHPLADAMPLSPDREDARAQLRLPASAPVIALLPGSRVSELQWHADVMIGTARRLAETRPDARFFVHSPRARPGISSKSASTPSRRTDCRSRSSSAMRTSRCRRRTWRWWRAAPRRSRRRSRAARW